MIDPEHEERYTQGECHVFAIACRRHHGGDFLVAFDTGEIHWCSEDGEDARHVVQHVFARLNAPDGRLVIRDIMGDRPDDRNLLREEIEERYGVWPGDILFEEMSAGELLGLICDPDGIAARDLEADEPCFALDHDDRQLAAYGDGCMRDAMALEEAMTPPGSRHLDPARNSGPAP